MSETAHPTAPPWRERSSSLALSDVALLLLGSGLLVFQGWSWNTPLAAWLAPFFLIRFFRAAPGWHHTLLAAPLMIGAMFLAMTGLWDLSTSFEIGINVARALPLLAGLYADRFFAHRIGEVTRSLVYPATFVVGDYLFTLAAPVGSVFSPASTHFGVDALVQLVSVTGLWGLAFVPSWFASTANGLWEAGLDLRRCARPVGLFAAVLLAIVVIGSLRLSAFPPEGGTVRIGSVATGRSFEIPTDGSDRDEAVLSGLHDTLFERSRQAVAAGARIVFWAEGNAALYERSEPAFLERAQAFAREHGVYLAPGMVVIHPGRGYGENKVMLIDPTGTILFSYEKTNTYAQTRADGILPVADTPYGRIAAAICFDLDHPVFINQLGDRGVDIALVPAWDNEGIAPFHTEVGLLRAVENGFSMVRHARGASAAVDYRGRILAYQDFYAVEDATMIVDVPTRGVRTLYGIVGDWPVFACGLFVLVLVASQVRPGTGSRRRSIPDQTTREQSPERISHVAVAPSDGRASRISGLTRPGAKWSSAAAGTVKSHAATPGAGNNSPVRDSGPSWMVARTNTSGLSIPENLWFNAASRAVASG